LRWKGIFFPFCLYWWNCWPSPLFKLSLFIIIGRGHCKSGQLTLV
jgi:hypothetical protein